MQKIIVTGHPYAFPYYFKVFEYVKNKDNFIFILPKVWRSRAVFNLQKRNGFEMYGLSVWSYGSKSFLGGAFKGWMPSLFWLIPYLKIKNGVKILYSCSEPNLITTLFNSITAKLFGLKYIIFTWQNVEPEKRMSGLKLKLSNYLVSINLKLADRIICGNKKAEVILKKISPNSRTGIFPLSGVDIDKFRPGIVSDWKEKLNLENNSVVLFYGALDKRKGLSGLIDAFKRLNRNDVKLIIVGKGSEKENLRLLVINYRLQNQVIFLDWLENDKLPGLICASDIFIYPSVPEGGWEEQFGYAMTEASACGLPVISTKTGSIEEVVIDGDTGILLEPGNSEQLAIAISKLLADDSLRKHMGARGRDYIVKNFSHEAIALKIENFLAK